jgi:hypothetical protein
VGRTCSTHGKLGNAHSILVGKPERKRPLVRFKRRWADNIRMVFREIGCEDVGWIQLAQNRVLWRVVV